MTQPDNSRPIGNTPVTDAAASTAPQHSSPETEYRATVSSNADLRVGENDDARDAAATATGVDIDNDHADERPIDRSDDTPENYNSEQDDERSQAQTVAGDAMRSNADNQSGEASEHGGATNPAQIDADDAQDVVDHMNQMQRSGRIDLGAYRGERNDDDQPEMIGEGGMEPDDIDEHGNKPRDQQFTPVE